MLRCFMREYCTDRGKAVALAPQVSDHFSASGRRGITNKAFRNQMAHVYVPVCRGHLDGWWDGSDPGVKRLPAFTVSKATIAATAQRRGRVAS